ncbi:TraB/GumN family protein [Saprospiraceae bacterium]|jgi:uncharacterized protein YbaP (TraB family)|nr:TraB/GumN family protein [Bacteroidota bacterium]MDB4727225.1 TraB/GumN family protein [Saprospiraceae bacterium]
MKSSKKALLWRIEHDQCEGVSFVFGTMHVRNLNIVTQQKRVFDKILSCTGFACEFNLDRSANATNLNSFYLPENQMLTDLIAPKKYQKICNVFAKTVGFELEKFNRFKPIFITNMLSELVLRKDMPYALDEYLWHFAKEQERNLKGIETLEEQMEILERLDLEYQIQSLISIGKNFSNFRKGIQKMTTLYLEGDIQKLYKATKKGSGKLRKILLFNRNKIMANRIDQFAKEETFFAAIGAGHLGGEKGVLRLLKLKGWKVKPVLNA